MAAKYKDIVYYCLDAVKSTNGDSEITEEHVLFLANHYRLFLIEQKKLKQGEYSLSAANEQTICIDLEQADAIEGLDYCNDIYLKSTAEVPDIINGTTIKVDFAGMKNIMATYVTKERFKYVGHNKYLQNIIYCTIGNDKHLYLNGNNPQFKYLKQVSLTGIFEDSEKAAELSCNKDSKTDCDVMEQDFPLESELIPQLIELINKELLGVNYRPKDNYNSSSDELADLSQFIRRNMKSPLVKQMTD